MATLSQHQFFEKNYLVNRTTFPTKTELNDLLYTTSFNQLLILIKNKIQTTDFVLQKYISISNQELSGKFQTNIIDDVKTFLLSKDYAIIHVEDASNNSIGWKLYWK